MYRISFSGNDTRLLRHDIWNTGGVYEHTYAVLGRASHPDIARPSCGMFRYVDDSSALRRRGHAIAFACAEAAWQHSYACTGTAHVWRGGRPGRTAPIKRSQRTRTSANENGAG